MAATCPAGTASVAEAVELLQLPVLGAVSVGTTNKAPCGIVCTLKTVPGGVLVAVSVTVTGLVVPGGSRKSGVAYEPVGARVRRFRRRPKP